MAAKIHCCSVSVVNDPMAWATCVQVCGYDCQCTHTCCFIMHLSPQDLEMMGWRDEGWLVTCMMTLFRVRKSCAPLNSLSCPRSPISSGKTRSSCLEMDQMQWMMKKSLHASTCSPYSTGHCCNCLSLHWTMKVSSAESATCIGRQALTHWGFQTHWLPSHGLASQLKLLPSMWLLLHANSYKEPHVRAGCQWGPKKDEPPQGCNMSPCQMCYPTLTPQTPPGYQMSDKYQETIREILLFHVWR